MANAIFARFSRMAAMKTREWYRNFAQHRQDLTIEVKKTGQPVDVDGKLFFGGWRNCLRTEDGDLLCPWCGKATASVQGMGRHVAAVHKIRIDSYGWLRSISLPINCQLDDHGLPLPCSPGRRTPDVFSAELRGEGLICCGRRLLADGRVAWMLR